MAATHRNGRYAPICALAALLLWAAPLAADEIAVSGADVAASCENYPESAKPRICEMYASELLDIIKSDDKLRNPLGRLCPPQDVPLASVIGSINTWLAGHPELHEKRAYHAVYGAMRRDYPCR